MATNEHGILVGTTSDGKYDVYVPYDALKAEHEDTPEAEWPTADDWAADFNGRGEATLELHIVETTIGERETVGDLGSVNGRVLMCVRSAYVRGDEDREGDMESGYYSDWSEPTADEQATPAYAAITQRIAAAKAEEEAALERVRRERRQENEERRRWDADHPELVAHLKAKVDAEGLNDNPPDQGLLDALFGDD